MTANVHPCGEFVGDKLYWRDGKGSLVPFELVKAEDQLEDEIVRRLVQRARILSKEIAAFRAECFEAVAGFNALMNDQYGLKKGHGKGNQTLTTYDARERVSVQIADLIDFGSKLQQAKGLIDECFHDWTADSGAELRAMVDHAFQVDKEGQINRGRLLSLRQIECKDERWIRAMQAIQDSIKVIGTKPYVRFHERASNLAGWTHISLDAATA